MADEKPIIIKKIKKGGHGAHGGAWKVAYADFVTAMMAFFLLLWLLTSTPVENLEGLADYFSPTVGLQGKMGIGFRGGKSPNSAGVSTGDWASQGLIFGAPPSGPIIKDPDRDTQVPEDSEDVAFREIEKDVNESVKGNIETQGMNDNVLIDHVPEGLRIQIFGSDRPMFEEQKADISPGMRIVLERIAKIIQHIPHYIKITGHTGEGDFGVSTVYSDWELSAERANAVRRFFLEKGMDAEQIAQIVGIADYEPINRKDMSSPKNRRVSVVLLKRSILPSHKQAIPDRLKTGDDDMKIENERR